MLTKSLNNNALPILVAVAMVTAFVIGTQPTTQPDFFDVALEGITLAVCTYLLFGIQEIKETSSIYKSLYLSLSMLVVGNGIDLLDEFYEISRQLSLIEEAAKATGLLLFVIACMRWVKFQAAQLTKIKQLAETDSLTGVANRRTFFRMTEEYFHSNDNSLESVCLLVIDIDDFKLLNDTYGHPVGDRVLTKTAATIQHTLRNSDVVARLGGEEFIVLLKRTDKAEAMTIANRIRESIREAKIREGDELIGCTVSIGVSTTSSTLSSFEGLYNYADKAMYKAKEQGKNRCLVCP
jgi:diguanylate cyclase (GGDEF)-like protein